MANINDIRNIVLIGHGSSGKTSLAESMLHKTGGTNRLGSVDEKTSICDYYEEEKEHQHSIQSAVVHTEYQGKTINIIDTPGYPDFMGPAIKAIPAAETAILTISASAGIETNTRKFFDIAKEANVPLVIVVNKIDSENVELPELLKSIQKTFGSECRCANLPSGDGSSVIDCISNDSGDSPVMDVGEAHMELFESIIEADDELMESYLAGEDIADEKIASVFVEAMKAGTVIPIVFTNAREEVGTEELLELVVNYCPSPAQGEPLKLVKEKEPAGEEEEPEVEKIEVKPDNEGPFAGLVFRIGFDPKSNMKYTSIKVLSGKITSDTNLLINDNKKGVRPGHVMKSQGPDSDEIDEGVAGDIITLAKVEELALDDLVHDGSFSGKFDLPEVQKPMFSLALEPASRGDEQKIGNALDKMMEEDPCFKAEHNEQTKELVISGLGELHLRVILEKMEKSFKLQVNTRQPKIPYKETITSKAEGHYRHKKQTGGAGQFGEVYLRIEPAERDSDPPLDYSWDIFGGAIPKQFEPAVLKGIQQVMETGVVAGYPMQDIKVSIYDGKHHPVDSKEVAFVAAGKGAFIDAVKKARPVLLEPIVNMEITVPAENMGDIAGDIASKRGRVQGQEMLAGNMLVIKAQAPLSEVSQYNSQLKSVTGGRGTYSMSLSHYDPVPSNVQAKVIEASKKTEEETE